ncbi:MAG: universal stress protein [Nitrospinae bacterium]|nr:universal stress protein [Nitrospinota bacterium]
MIRMDKILFPTDFSEFSKNALRYAISFAQEYKAKLIVLHVIENIYPYSGFAETAFPVVELYTDVEKYAQKEMESLAGGNVPKDLSVETIITRGTPFLEIVNAAKEKEVDLIVIATHGRTGLEHVFFGSTAEKVVRKAPCPVLTIRNPEHEFVHP